MGLDMIDVGWLSILPPVIAIVLALTTKEVYSSLFLGVISGTLIYCLATGQSVIRAVSYAFDMMAQKIGDNGYMIIFLVLLGALIVVVTRSGGTYAYGQWAAKRIRGPISAKLATALLGIVIFIDDGFNCLTVGTVMRPITDRCQVSREKLAYLLDATAAPVCIIAPISSWAVAVSSEMTQAGGLTAFMQTIPFNLYALLTLCMVLIVSVTSFDFGPMKKAEIQKRKEIHTKEEKDPLISENGKVFDLVLPLVTMILCAIAGMAYVGGYFEGTPFAEAIGANPTAGLTLGTFAGLLVAFVLYIPRKLMRFQDFMTGIVDGIKTMIAPLLILVFAWALSGVCREMLGTGQFVSQFVSAIQLPMEFLPALVFVIAAFLSFATGTAWGTFGILLPIVMMIGMTPEGKLILIPALGATLAGSVYGDHCSPISDTTILSSTGAQCVHLRHVETQMPYATLVAAVCVVGYIIAGFTQNAWITLAASILLLLVCLVVLWLKQKKVKS